MNQALFGQAPANETDYKICCASFYEIAAVRFLLGDSWRPGGVVLTEEIAAAAGIEAKSMVLDIACGAGDSSRVLAGQLSAEVVGLDLSLPSLGLAQQKFAGEPWWPQTSWTGGEAENLPFAANSFDVALVECALCTFPNKPAAVSEVRRVLKHGGRFALADVTLDRGALPVELEAPLARVACLADALPIEEYIELLRAEGFEIDAVKDCAPAVGEFLKAIDKKLLLARIAQAVGKMDLGGVDIQEARRLLKQAIDCVSAGTLGYAYIVAHAD